jgi:hypothetical protein
MSLAKAVERRRKSILHLTYTLRLMVVGVAVLLVSGCATTPTPEQIGQFSFNIRDTRITREAQPLVSAYNVTTGEWSFNNVKPKEGYVFVIVNAVSDFPMRVLKVDYKSELYLQTKTGPKRKFEVSEWLNTKQGSGFVPLAGREWKSDESGKKHKLLFNVPEEDVSGSVIRFYGKSIPLSLE